MKKPFVILLSIFVVTTVLGFSLRVAFSAWSEPSQNPPLGNTDPPLTSTTGDQGRVGRFGIGTTTPGTARLAVYDTADATLALRADSDNNASDSLALLQFEIDTGTVKGRIGYSQVLDRFVLGYGANDHIAIDSSGNVGIGTTTPAFKLDVTGTASFSQPVIVGTPTAASHAATKSYVDTAVGGGGGAGSFSTLTVSGNTFLATTSGNVGIGTVSPDGKLHVMTDSAGAVTADADADDLTVESSGNTGLSLLGSGDDILSIYFGNPGTNGQRDAGIRYYQESYSVVADRRDMAFIVGGSVNERMRIDSAGNVGIGTTSPVAKLHVNTGTGGQVRITDSGSSQIQLSAANGAGGFQIGRSLAATNVNDFFIYDNTNAATRFFIDNAGNVGIGTTSPADKLHVVGNATITGLSACTGNDAVIRVDGTSRLVCGSIAAGAITGSGTANYITKWTSGSAIGNSVIYETGGNVGIGTTSPGVKLHVVNGDIQTENAGTAGTNAMLKIKSGASGLGRIIFADTVSDYGYIDYDQSADDFIFRNAGATTVTIKSSGNVGIGATTPTYKLQVAGSFSADSGNITTDNLGNITAESFFDRTNPLYKLDPSNTGTSLSIAGIITSNGAGNNYFAGNVGIGTTGPTQLLTMSSASSPRVRITDTTNNAQVDFGVADTEGFLGTQTNHVLKIQTNNADRVTIDTSGNVGIGTTSPGSMLEIKNSSNRSVDSYSPLSTDGNGANLIWSTNTTGSTKADVAYFGAVQDGATQQSGKFYWQVANAGTPGVVMTLNKAGNLGIGTSSPAHRLSVIGDGVAGSLALYSGQTVDDGIIVGYVPSTGLAEILGLNHAFSVYNDLGIRVTNNTQLYLKTDGNVGIGTTSPQATLSVVGVGDNNTMRLGVNAAGSTTLRLDTFNDAGQESNNRNWAFRNRYNDFGLLELMRSTNSTGDPLTVAMSWNRDGNVIIPGNLTVSGSCTGCGGGGQWTTSGSNIYNANTGNVGIGTTGPTAKLTVLQSGTLPTVDSTTALLVQGATNIDEATSTGAPIVVRNTQNMDKAVVQQWFTSGALANNELSLFGTGDNAGFQSRSQSTGAVRAMVFNPSGGNVGIGDTGPANKLSVTGKIVASDALQISSSNPSYFLGTGNVGIGTIGPSNKLHVNGTPSDNLIRFENDSTTFNDSSIRFRAKDSSGNNSHMDFGIKATGGNETGYFYFKAPYTSSERMVINTSGNVGIGTTGPIGILQARPGTDRNLLVRAAPGAANGVSVESINDANTANMSLEFRGNPSVFTTGNVGIGTASPGEKLSVAGNIFLTGDRSEIYGTDRNHMIVLRGRQDGTVANETSYYQYGDHVFYTNGLVASQTEKMRIKDNGNVGIGTASPGAKLDVLGGSGDVALFRSSTRSMYVALDSGGSGIFTGAGETGSGVYLNAASNYVATFISGAEKVRVDANGNVGIGTTGPGAKLEVYSSRTSGTNVDALVLNDNVTGIQANGFGKFIVSKSNSGNSISKIGFLETDGTNNNTSITFYTANTAGSLPERMRIDQSGNVGIGTTTPGYKLDVQGGQINTSGGLCIAGDCKTAWSQVGGGAWTLSGSNLYPTSTGYNVGIGTTSSDFKLAVVRTDQGVYNPVSYNPAQNLDIRFNNADQAYGFIHFASHGSMENSFGVVQQGASGQGDFVFQAYSTNGSGYQERMRITNTGNVGIGDTGPTNKLAVSGDIAASGSLKITGNGNSYIQTGNVGIGTTSPTIYGGGLEISRAGQAGVRVSDAVSGNKAEFGVDNVGGYLQTVNAGGSLIFYTNAANVTAMKIDSTGKVGIGTTSPSGKLTIRGVAGSADASLDIVDDATGNKWSIRQEGSGTLAFQNQGFDRVTILSGGNVGIGTTAPARKLTLYEGTAAATQEIRMDGNTNTVHRLAWDLGNKYLEYSQVTGSISFANASASDFVIKNTGNVGIGTTSPSNILHVAAAAPIIYVQDNNNVTADSGFSSYVRFADSAGNQAGYVGDGGSGQEMSLWGESGYVIRFGTNGLERMRITTNGDVGIGNISPHSTLEIGPSQSGQIFNVGGSSAGQVNWRIGGQIAVNGGFEITPSTAFGNFTFSNPALVIKNDGNVGIGTTSPGAKLDMITVSNATSFRIQNTVPNTIFDVFNDGGDGLVRLRNSSGGIGALFGGGIVNTYFNANGGNFGIGSTAPGYKLDVQGGQINTSGGLCIAGDCKTAWSQVGGGTTYDSGWFAVTQNASYTKTHNLGVLPGRATVWFSANSNGNNAKLMGIITLGAGTNWQGISLRDCTTTSCQVVTGTSYVVSWETAAGGEHIQSGYARIVLTQ